MMLRPIQTIVLLLFKIIFKRLPILRWFSTYISLPSAIRQKYPINISIDLPNKETTKMSKNSKSKNISLLLLINKLPKWFKYLLIILTIIFVFKSNIYLYLLPYITIQSLYYFWLFMLFNTIIYFYFNYMFLIILNKNIKFKIPSNLPGFIRNQLKSLKGLSTDEYCYNREKKRNKLLAIVSLIVFISAIFSNIIS